MDDKSFNIRNKGVFLLFAPSLATFCIIVTQVINSVLFHILYWYILQV